MHFFAIIYIITYIKMYILFVPVVIGVMGSGTYFTDLVNGVQESHDLSPTAVTPIDHGPAASKGSQGRTKIFGDDEDKLLVLLG